MRYTTYLTTAHVCVLGMWPLFSISLCIFITWLGTVPGHHALRVRRPDVYSRFAPWVSGFVHQRSLLFRTTTQCYSLGYIFASLPPNLA